MNIRIIFCSTLMTAAFAACSQMDENEAAWQGGENVGVGLNSDVEVRLSVGGLSTRASIESKTDSFAVDSLGIYMLATDIIGVNPQEVAPINWLDIRCNKMDNVATNAIWDSGTRTTSLVWADPTASYWYPYENWYAFRFYGYYPRVSDSEVNRENRRMTATYTELDGTTDIIWGQSLRSNQSDEYDKYRYSAKYFRQAGYSDKLPSLAFEHKLMRIQFYIQGVADNNYPANPYEMANKMVLDSVVMYARHSGMAAGEWDSIPTTADLIVADLDTPSNEGTIRFNWNGNRSPIPMFDENDTPYLSKKQVHNDSLIKVGQPILLPVPDEDEVPGFLYGAKVYLRLADGQSQMKFYDAAPLDLNLNANTAEYQAGHTYKVVINISGPQKVTLKATLTPWEEVDEEGFDNLDLN